MANYYSKCKSNNFRVTDVDAFCNLMKESSGEWPEGIGYDVDENNTVCFYSDGAFYGIVPDEDDPYYDEAICGEGFEIFIIRLQEILDPDTACVIKTIGWEKMRYLTADAFVITKKDCVFMTLDDFAIQKAKKLLNHGSWKLNG